MTSLIETSNPALLDLIGVAGFGLYVINYTLLTFHKLHSHDALYFGINLVAASCVLAGLLVSFNLASAMIQLFWVFISTAAIAVRLFGRQRGSAHQFTEVGERERFLVSGADETARSTSLGPIPQQPR